MKCQFPKLHQQSWNPVSPQPVGKKNTLMYCGSCGEQWYGKPKGTPRQERWKILDALPVGSMIQLEQVSATLFKPEQDVKNNLDGCWISLSTGKIFHFSQLGMWGEITVLKDWAIFKP